MTPIRKCLFPAAGYGTRFLPATKAMPKEMLPVVNKPLIQYGVEEAARAGIADMAFVTGRGERALKDHFAVSHELERRIAGSERESLLEDLCRLVRECHFSYTRQLEARGLGHAILTGETLIGDQAFAVLLADDFCVTEDAGVLAQLAAIYDEYQCSVVAIEEVPKAETSNYGIIAGEELGPGLYRVSEMVEKPEPGEAPGNLAVIGRYILTPDIFDILRSTPPGRNNEIQITDALQTQAHIGRVLAWRFRGRRFDCGSVPGFMAANEFAWRRQSQSTA
ncbi:MAG: UTP--glucose-1-phosphate uridylyltransferase GalU [Gammaproteobacteria bacterium]|nr:UTP--glucose-1-phosphate uridylyltransferase GalU [Gammaproteobacteria bacterium]